MAEEEAPKQEVVEQEPQVEAEPVEPPVEGDGNEPEPEVLDKEPGGDDGEAVYQRRLHRENKKLKEQNQQAQLEQARLAERLKLLEEQQQAKQPPPQEPRIYTVAEIEAAVDAGNISRLDAERYKDEVIFPHKLKQAQQEADRQRQHQEALQKPLVKAATELQEYVAVAPYLADDTDPRTIEIANKFMELRRDYGLPDNFVTKALAVKQSLGPIENLKKRGEARRLTRTNTLTHAETSAGGTGKDRGGDDPVSKVPQDLVNEWRRHGYTEEQVKKYSEHHLKKMAGRAARFGR